jgi:hypothetical protein
MNNFIKKNILLDEIIAHNESLIIHDNNHDDYYYKFIELLFELKESINYNYDNKILLEIFTILDILIFNYNNSYYIDGLNMTKNILVGYYEKINSVEFLSELLNDMC